jgi:hypothetical protein
MKRSSLLFCWIIAISASGQLTSDNETAAASSGTPQHRNSVRTVIWSEDFAGGIPGDWINEEADGTALWEYRGPATEPSVNVGSRGSCTQNFVGPPIQSPTSGNGFIIFDSNYWDNSDSLCTLENMGTGPAPGPHLAILTTPPVDLTGYENIAIRFHQFVRYFTGNTRVEMDAGDGAGWTPIYAPEYFQGFSGPNSEAISIPLPSAAQGAPDVRFRFVYDGLYYHWQIDDIEVVEIQANDLAIRAVAYDNYDPTDPNGEYAGMEYSHYPMIMAPLLRMSAKAENTGTLTQTNCRLGVVVSDALTGEVLHNSVSSTGTTIAPTFSAVLQAGSFQMPAVPGKYRVRFELLQDQDDGDPANDADSAEFYISTSTWARDKVWTTAVYNPTINTEQKYIAGNIFQPAISGYSPQSISIGLGEGTLPSGMVYGAIYEFDIDELSEINLVASTDTVPVDMTLLNGAGDQKLLTLPFPEPPVLEANEPYFIVAGSVQGPDTVKFALAGASPMYSSWVIFDTLSIYYLSRMPVVRLNTGPLTNVADIGMTNELLAYPNPAGEFLYVLPEGNSGSILEVIVRDAFGRRVHTESSPFRTGRKIPLNALEPGIYLAECRSPNTTRVIRFIKE